MKAVDILLVEDNPGDVRLTQEALNEYALMAGQFTENAPASGQQQQMQQIA